MSSGLLQRVSALKDMISSDASDGVSGSLDRLSAFEQARALISGLDGASSIVNILGIPRWTSLVGVLQKIAYLDPDSGGERDIALWCERQWATVLQEHPQNIAALQGLGHAWLLKSQQMLARIHSSGGSLSSEGGSSPTRHRSSRWRHLSQVANGDEDAARINSPNYIEARDLLRPSLDSFARAVSAADAQGVVAGELLELSAEAYISFGNVSHPRNNETCYQRALSLLRRASQLADHTMDPYLREFLEDNIAYMSSD